MGALFLVPLCRRHLNGHLDFSSVFQDIDPSCKLSDDASYFF